VAKVINDTFGIEKGLMTTVHAYTNDQRVQDLPHSDMRRARAAALSMIPTSTGAAKAIGLVIPELKGKLDGFAMRVPVANVSVVDLTCTLKKDTTAEEVNNTLKASAGGKLKGILDYTSDDVVSVDFNHSTASATIDSKMTKVISGNLLKVIAWYDNEWAYSCRVVDLIEYMIKKGL
jgi:glyceraldehyde 3-phosphate dehydrogenase